MTTWARPRISERLAARHRLRNVVANCYRTQAAYAAARGVSCAFVANMLSGRRPLPAWARADIDEPITGEAIKTTAPNYQPRALTLDDLFDPRRRRSLMRFGGGEWTVAGQAGVSPQTAQAMVGAGWLEDRPHRWTGGRTTAYRITPAGRAALAETEERG